MKSCYAELHERFSKELWELSLIECFAETRPIYYETSFEHFDQECEFCERQALFEWTDNRYGDKEWVNESRILFLNSAPTNYRKKHCGHALCKELAHFYWTSRQGQSHRVAFRAFFGYSWRQLPKEIAVPAMVANMLRQKAIQLKKGIHHEERESQAT